MKKTIALILCIMCLSVNAYAMPLSDGQALTGGAYTATGENESAIDVSGNVNASITDVTIAKTNGKASSADDASFRGLNAAVRVYDQASLVIDHAEINASAPNATGVFAYDDGKIFIANSTVRATGGGAGGVQVAGGGTLVGVDLDVTSASKAAIRSDRGGGTMLLDGGTYVSTGQNGCPAIYSTADITVKNATCISENSRAVIIEGKNTVTLENTTLEGNDQSTKEGSVKANVLLYQSASGDASEGTSVFTMKGGAMTSHSGAMFYCTNTSSVVNLEQAELTLSDTNTLLIVSAGRWGKDGKNGGDCIFNAYQQSLDGDIQVDGISSLQLNLIDSDYAGAITGEGSIMVSLKDSSWTLTGDSWISRFDGDLTQVIPNGYHLYIDNTLTL